MNIAIEAIPGLPEIEAGADLGEMIAASGSLRGGEIVVIVQKVVSKAEGRAVRLQDVTPGDRAQQLARETEKDPRLVQLILGESREVLRATPGVIVVETRQGFVCANAGIDASNVPGDETVLLLPEDADASAAAIRKRIAELTEKDVGVVISDSFGRAWRIGQQDVAIGCSGIDPAADLRGENDRQGRELTASITAFADELASAADLTRGKSSGEPIAIVRGLENRVIDSDGPGVRPLIRDKSTDLFR